MPTKNYRDEIEFQLHILLLFGGFFFDRARGKPVTLDIGLGPFKTRVIGPKDLDVNNDDDWSVDITNTGPSELAVIVISGFVKAAGQASKVRLCSCER